MAHIINKCSKGRRKAMDRRSFCKTVVLALALPAIAESNPSTLRQCWRKRKDGSFESVRMNEYKPGDIGRIEDVSGLFEVTGYPYQKSGTWCVNAVCRY